MKTITKLAIAGAVGLCSVATASAQYYQLANQATNMLQTVFSGGANYRGFFDLSYVNGIGNKQANFFSITTTQGVKYGDLFFMGIGLGVDFMHTEVNDGYYKPAEHSTTDNAAMIPMFTDFRLTLGQPQNVGFFVDLKIGAAFYVSDDYILVGDGYINTSTSFYLKPSVGVRVPVSKSNPKLALNFGASYQLLTNSYWYNPGQRNSISLSSMGLNVGFEW